MGNICRSPMAEGVFRKMMQDEGLGDRFEVASAATGSWHLGHSPHEGTLQQLEKHDIQLRGKRAQKLTQNALDSYDYIVVMDQENVEDVRYAFDIELPRLLDFTEGIKSRDIPDPYYSGNFEHVYNLVEAGCRGLLNHIQEKEKLNS